MQTWSYYPVIGSPWLVIAAAGALRPHEAWSSPNNLLTLDTQNDRPDGRDETWLHELGDLVLLYIYAPLKVRAGGLVNRVSTWAWSTS